MIASIVSRELHFESWYALHILGLASMLHDIGLQGMPDHFKDEDMSVLTEVELNHYKKHPERGAEILKSVKDVPPSVVEAVLHHHCRKNRRGFPPRARGENLSILAELVGASDEFNLLIKRTAFEPGMNPEEAMKEKLQSEFSRAVAEAFRHAFFSSSVRA